MSKKWKAYLEVRILKIHITALFLMPKKYTLLKREAYFQVKSAKNDKVEAILKLGYAKRVRLCGTKYISKLK
jgi:hypothetical protein